MSRYFTRPKSARPTAAPEGDCDDPLLPSLNVSDHEAVDTGLFDQRGDTIWRGPNEMGFHNPRERG